MRRRPSCSCPVSHASRARHVSPGAADGRGLLPAHASDTDHGHAQCAGCWVSQSVEKGAGCAGAGTDVVLTPHADLLDFDVFMSIPSASDQGLFSARANLESTGFLYSDNYEEGGTRQEEQPNAGALPIGVVKDTRGEGHTPLAKHAQDLTQDYVGLTCAACHTGDLVETVSAFSSTPASRWTTNGSSPI